MTGRAQAIAEAFEGACRDELEAPKPGNVHDFAAGHRMTAEDFVRSAAAAAAPLATPRARVGARILAAIEATLAAVGTNTNLGIVLLCAPLAAAAETAAAEPRDALRIAVDSVLAGLDVADAELAFAAIRRAAPAGLGRSAQHDVFAPATVTLRAAMAAAAEHDRIARQYATGFADIFDRGEPALARMLPRNGQRRWATLALYLEFLAAFPDTHVVRKHGPAIAEQTRHQAAAFRARLEAVSEPEALLPELLAWDWALKRAGINPGTSADLTVATLFVHRLRAILPPQRISG